MISKGYKNQSDAPTITQKESVTVVPTTASPEISELPTRVQQQIQKAVATAKQSNEPR